MIPNQLNIHIRNIDITFENILEAESLIINRIKEINEIFY
jgi:hypothetical protein